MQINHVKINNILGIDHLEFEAGQFVTIGGANGLGKTSVLEAIKAALGKGQDATLLRSGADKGEVVLVLDNGGTISAKVTAAGTTRAVKSAEGKTSAKPAQALAGLVDLMSVNPVDFLLAKPADRARTEALRLLRGSQTRQALACDPEALPKLRPLIQAAGLAA